MLNIGERVVVGLSGGSDSVALLFVLKNLGFEIFAVHINHGLRGEESLRDENMCAKLCKKLNIHLEIYNINVKEFAAKSKLSIEEAGRNVRYNCFNEVLKKQNANKIAVAHNYNDNVETMLMNFFRGSGTNGMKGVSPTRGRVIRPLIECTKEEIDEFCKENSLEYVVDSSNLETNYMRNKIRLELLPYLKKEINPSIEESIMRFANLSQLDNDYIDNQAYIIYENIAKISDDKSNIDIERFNLNHKAVKQRIIRMAYEDVAQTLKNFGLKHCEAVLELVEKGETGKSINLPDNVVAEISYKTLIIRKKAEVISTNIKLYKDCFLKIGETSYFISLSLNKNFKKENYINTCFISLNYDTMIGGELFIRHRETGDRLYKSKKLKDYFIDNKIPREKRDKMLVISDENSNIFCIFDESFESKLVSTKYETEDKIYIGIWRKLTNAT